MIDAKGLHRPEITLGATVIIPTGEGLGEQAGPGFGVSLRASQQLNAKLFAHAVLGYSEAPDRDFAVFRRETSEWNAGAGLAYALPEAWFLTLEYEFAREGEDEGAGRAWEGTHTAALGIAREIAEDLVLGAAGAVEASGTAQLRALIQFEF